MFERVWSYPICHRVGAFAIDGDDCFVAARSAKLVSLCASTGEPRWSVRIQGPHGWLAFNSRTVFYLNQHALLIAVGRRTGEVLWSCELRGINGWLHASRERVVVGGWRGYSDLVALDADDGRICWSRSARSEQLHSTQIHEESQSLVIVEPTKARVVFVRLTDGQEFADYPASGWGDKCLERPTGTTRPGDAAVLRRTQHELLVVAGASPSVRSVEVSADIVSTNLACVGSLVPFMASSHELVAVDINENRLLALGSIRHNRRDVLPFCADSPESFLVGTSFGELRRVSRSGHQLSSQKMGKRIATNITLAGTVAVFGTDSGEVLGVRVKANVAALPDKGQ